MNHLLNVTKKELRELFTPGAVASVVLVIVIFVVMGQAMSGQSDEVSAPPSIGVVYEEDAGTVIYDGYTYQSLVEKAYMATYGTTVDLSHIHVMKAAYGDDKAITDEISGNGYKYAIALPKALHSNLDAITPTHCESTTIPVYYVYKSGGVFSSTSSITSASLVSSISTLLSMSIVSDVTSADVTTAYNMEHPVVTANSQTHTLVNGKVYEGVTPYQISNTQLGQSMMIPIVVMLVITMVGSVVVSSMGSEKENKTLETLLTMPVKRTVIVSGKLLAAAIMGLFYGGCYLIGMMSYSNGLSSGLSSINLNDYGLGMTPVGWIMLFVILFLSIFSALGICMILGAFTKNYKMAQTMVMPVSVMAIIPMMVLLFSDWNSLPTLLQGIMFVIPFSHPMMAMSNIVLGETALIMAGVAYLAILDAVLVFITVRLYNSDILITGLDKAAVMNKLKTPRNKRKTE